ncbi:MAG TPA: Sec-independent protein translocase protein TatB [Acidimicrobiales bacterium]|nr:Sec-independent protein translocase protein TatB [Acidimicrobiales bacterium]
MLNIGPAELLVVLVVALLVLGPNKLPDAARQVGKAIGEMRKLSTGFQAEMRDAMKEPVDGKPGPGSKKTTPASGGGTLASPRLPAGDVPTGGPTDVTDVPTSPNGRSAPTNGESSDADAEPGTSGATNT